MMTRVQVLIWNIFSLGSDLRLRNLKFEFYLKYFMQGEFPLPKSFKELKKIKKQNENNKKFS